jgi:hypothetical protein
MNRIPLLRLILASRAATTTMVACRLLAGYLVSCGFAIQGATNSLDK